MLKYLQLFAVAFSTSGLFACTGTDSGDAETTPDEADTQKYAYFGLITAEQSNSTEAVVAEGAFYRLDSTTVTAALDAAAIPDRDTCIYKNISLDTRQIQNGDRNDASNDVLQGGIDAGLSLQLLANDRVLIELLRQETASTTVYTSSEHSFVVSPYDNLTLDVPGGMFPSLSHLPLSLAPELSIYNLDSAGTLSADSTLEWNAPATAEHSTRIIVDVTAQASLLDDIESVHCIVVDDGNFEFPSELRSKLHELKHGWQVHIYRQAVTIVQQSDLSMLVVATRDAQYGRE